MVLRLHLPFLYLLFCLFFTLTLPFDFVNRPIEITAPTSKEQIQTLFVPFPRNCIRRSAKNVPKSFFCHFDILSSKAMKKGHHFLTTFLRFPISMLPTVHAIRQVFELHLAISFSPYRQPSAEPCRQNSHSTISFPRKP